MRRENFVSFFFLSLTLSLLLLPLDEKGSWNLASGGRSPTTRHTSWGRERERERERGGRDPGTCQVDKDPEDDRDLHPVCKDEHARDIWGVNRDR